MTARVLVVDDLEPNVKLLEAKLRAEYFDVIGAYSGEEALRLTSEEKPDIILLDVMMPGMDGFEVCRRLKASDSADSHCPDGIDTTAPRTSSEMLAMTGSEKPIVAFSQSGMGMIRSPIRISKGSRSMMQNSSTSQGEFRKSWVVSQLEARTGGISEICPRPRITPRAVPMAMAEKLMIKFRPKPWSSSGVQRHSVARIPWSSGAVL